MDRFRATKLHRGHPPDPLAKGSVWTGSFSFRPPITDYHSDVRLSVTERRPGGFRGIYATEDGQYVWEVEGTTGRDTIRWEFPREIKGDPEHSVVGHAVVEGRIEGKQMVVVFTNPDHGVADMTLNRSGP
jgi:hypothetical protein